jgi:hypothetical protein
MAKPHEKTGHYTDIHFLCYISINLYNRRSKGGAVSLAKLGVALWVASPKFSTSEPKSELKLDPPLEATVPANKNVPS